MNGYEADEMEALLGTLEYDEADESDELAEQRGRRRFPRMPSTGGGLPPQRPQGAAVTQTQIVALEARVNNRIKKVDDNTRRLEGRVNTVNAELGRQGTVLKKEIADRKKDVEAARREQRQTAQLLALLPLIVKPGARTITADVDGLKKDDRVLIDTDGLSALLPLLLIGGLGGGGVGGGGGMGLGGEGDQSTLLILALALGGGLGGKR